jgi:DNA phosphorothioation-associated putative methyltransferase
VAVAKIQTNLVERHLSALHRTQLSRPIARALDDGIISDETSVFDYGCGRGGDLERLQQRGIECEGFDPHYRPDSPLRKADVVNLGYVVNVIEDPQEREEVLERAWDLAERVLVVSARLVFEARDVAGEVHADGTLTCRGTFQKLFQQDELRAWMSETLGTAPIAAEPGIFYVFKDGGDAEAFVISRVGRRARTTRRSDVVFEEHEELLREFMSFVERTGRTPRAGEFGREHELRESVGTPKQAFAIIKNITGEEHWDRLRVSRYEDLLVYLALSRFRRRPRISQLPAALQHDIKDFFGSYKAACDQADKTLFGLADQERIRDAARAASVGKRLPGALYVHSSGVNELPVALRVLEGCGRELLGELPEVSVIRLDLDRPRVAFLEYLDFDTDPHPQLNGVYTAVLDAVRADYQDYGERKNPPILHRKELFVAETYPLRERFARLTAQEERAGLFKNATGIGTKLAWEERVNRAGYQLRGHRLVRQ